MPHRLNDCLHAFRARVLALVMACVLTHATPVRTRGASHPSSGTSTNRAVSAPAPGTAQTGSEPRPPTAPTLREVTQALVALLRDPAMPAPEKERRIATVARAPGRAAAGRPVFDRLCANCHRVQGRGTDFGPDLSQVAERLSRGPLIRSVLFPNEDVAAEWRTTSIVTDQGEEIRGILESEDAAIVTLKVGGDLRQPVSKAAIEEREVLKTSPMPEGLAAGLSAQEFLDLVEFLGSLKASPIP